LITTEQVLGIDRLWWLCPGWNRVVFGVPIVICALVETSSWRKKETRCNLSDAGVGGRREACFEWAILLAGAATENEGFGEDEFGDAAGARRAGHGKECTSGMVARAEAATETAGWISAGGGLVDVIVLETRVMLRRRGMPGRRGHACLFSWALSRRTSRKARSVESNEREDEPR